MGSEDVFLRLDPYNFDSEFKHALFFNYFTVEDIKDIFQKGLISLEEYHLGLDYLMKGLNYEK